MKLAVELSRQFDKDIKILSKRGKNLEKLWGIVEDLASSRALQAKNRLHKLSGNWVNFWECHVEPDWLLIFERSQATIILVRTGTHSDLF